MFFLGGGKCPNLGVVNVRILGVVNVRLANNLTPAGEVREGQNMAQNVARAVNSM